MATYIYVSSADVLPLYVTRRKRWRLSKEKQYVAGEPYKRHRTAPDSDFTPQQMHPHHQLGDAPDNKAVKPARQHDALSGFVYIISSSCFDSKRTHDAYCVCVSSIL